MLPRLPRVPPLGSDLPCASGNTMPPSNQRSSDSLTPWLPPDRIVQISLDDSTEPDLPSGYAETLASLKELAVSAQLRAQQASRTMIGMYWGIGRTTLERTQPSGIGTRHGPPSSTGSTRSRPICTAGSGRPRTTSSRACPTAERSWRGTSRRIRWLAAALWIHVSN